MSLWYFINLKKLIWKNKRRYLYKYVLFYWTINVLKFNLKLKDSIIKKISKLDKKYEKEKTYGAQNFKKFIEAKYGQFDSITYEGDWEEFSKERHQKYLNEIKSILGEERFEDYYSEITNMNNRKSAHLNNVKFRWALI